MKKCIIGSSVVIFSLLTCFPAESVNQNAVLIKISNEVKALTEKTTQRENKLDEILNILSKQQEEYRKQVRPNNEETVKLLKEIKDLLQKINLENQNDN